MLPYKNERRKTVPITFFSSQWLNLRRMIAFSFSRDVPMSVGWNARRESLNIINNIWLSSAKSTQSIFYLNQINQLPTSIGVVGETLKRAFAFANQSERDSIAVTYDLAIAKITIQLQAEESPKYDKVFFAMGSFHMELTMFGAIGKYIAESGAEQLLNETHVIEKGSLSGFFTERITTAANDLTSCLRCNWR